MTYPNTHLTRQPIAHFYVDVTLTGATGTVFLSPRNNPNADDTDAWSDAKKYRPWVGLVSKIRVVPIDTVKSGATAAVKVDGFGTETIKAATDVSTAGGTTLVSRADSNDFEVSERNRLMIDFASAASGNKFRVHIQAYT